MSHTKLFLVSVSVAAWLAQLSSVNAFAGGRSGSGASKFGGDVLPGGHFSKPGKCDMQSYGHGLCMNGVDYCKDFDHNSCPETDPCCCSFCDDPSPPTGPMPGSKPGSEAGPSHACDRPLPDGSKTFYTGDENSPFCGRSDGSSVGQDQTGCEDMPDELVAQLSGLGKACPDLNCDGSEVDPGNPSANPTIEKLIKDWCPKKCGGCGDVCNDKPWLLEANLMVFGFPSIPTCEAAAETKMMPATSGSFDLDKNVPNCATKGDGLLSCSDADETSTGCCWWTKEGYMSNPTCGALFRMACPSMSGICDAC